MKAAKNFHAALYESGVKVQAELCKTLSIRPERLHLFHSDEELYRGSPKLFLDFIFMAASGDLKAEAEQIERIKAHPSLTSIPLILYHPNPTRTVELFGLKCGADEFLSGEWDSQRIAARIEMVLSRSRRDVSVNPSSRLPGPQAIELELRRRLSEKESFAVCYADLDNFKAYNDYYGYSGGDRVIQLVAWIIRDTVYDLCPTGFVGHIGGDDFIYLVPLNKAEPVSAAICRTFDLFIPTRYAEKDLQRGKIIATNRKGELEEFPIMTLSVAILPNRNKAFTHVGEIAHMLADLKKRAKQVQGPPSRFVVERRRKY
ncbi:MAG TPA: diguanylate cyclase [Verrucomicrobiae bacterium]|nr:diguanylate cyclase [Verrucomicrobiae bacterium]